MNREITSFDSTQRYTIEDAETIVQNIIFEYKRRYVKALTNRERQNIKKQLNWKKLKDEIIPIIKVAKAVNADQIAFSLKDNVSYDGILFIENKEQYVECVSSINYEKLNLVNQILESVENDCVCIPASYTNNDLKKSVNYSTNKHKISKQIETDFESGYIDFNIHMLKGYRRVLKKVHKGISNNCYEGYWLILTIERPILGMNCSQDLILTVWNNRIINNPFRHLFIYETAGDTDDFKLVAKI